jgi:glycosyltransferase involved in cell wall biosynthesis
MEKIVEPRVSIILPVYNGEETIESTINSLLNQTYNDFELLICIDGSHDGSLEVLKGFKDERIIMLANDNNIGLAATLNRLIRKVSDSSVYIAMAEQDDWYYPYRLEEQVAFLDSTPEYGLVSGIAEHCSGDNSEPFLFPDIIINGGQYPKEHEEFFKLNYRYQSKVVNTCMMFRKSVYIENGLYFSCHYPNVSVDWSFILRFSKFASIYGLNSKLVRMDRRKERDSITSNAEKKNKASFELIRHMRFEFREILCRKDYINARLNQKIVTAATYPWFKRFILMSWYFFLYPGNQMVIDRFQLELSRLKNKF